MSAERLLGEQEMGLRKKRIGYAAALAFGCLMCAGCGNDKEQSDTVKKDSQEDETKLVVAYVTSAAAYQEDQKMVEEEIKKQVRRKLNMEVDFKVIDTGTKYEEEIYSMLAGKQQLDIIYCYSDIFSKLLMNQQLYPLDAMLEEYGEGITEEIGEEVLSTCRTDGELYMIPTNHDFAVSWEGYILNKEILDKYQIQQEDITSMEKLEEVFALVKEKEPQMEIVDSDSGGMLVNEYFANGANGPFGVHMDYGREEAYTNIFKTEEYKEILERIYRWRQLGYLTRDLLDDSYSTDQSFSEGKLFAYACRGKPGIEQQEKLSTGREVVFIQLGEDTVSSNSPSAVGWSVTRNSISPGKAMQLLNLFYTDPEIMNLLSYGVEGVHYVKMEDGHITFPEGKTTNPFIGEAWRMPNQFITYVWEGNPLTLWEDMRRFNEESLHDCDYGFNFDVSAISSTYLKLQKIYEKYKSILENGLVDPDVGLAEMNRELDANFIEEVIEEKQRQYDEWKREKERGQDKKTTSKIE